MRGLLRYSFVAVIGALPAFAQDDLVKDGMTLIDCAAVLEVAYHYEEPEASAYIDTVATKALLAVAAKLMPEMSAEDAMLRQHVPVDVARTGGAPEWMWPIMEAFLESQKPYLADIAEQMTILIDQQLVMQEK